jgi:hypothetical protein
MHNGVSDARCGYSEENLIYFNNHYSFYEALCENSITVFTVTNNGVDYEINCMFNAGSEEINVMVNGDYNSEVTVYGYHTIEDIIDTLIDEYPQLLGLNVEDEALTVYDVERYSLNFNYVNYMQLGSKNDFIDINNVIKLEAVRMLLEEVIKQYNIMDRIKTVDYYNRDGDIKVVTDFNVIEITNFNIINITDPDGYKHSRSVFGIKDTVTQDESLIRICINEKQ